MRVVFSRPARLDLREIVFYIARDNSQRARSYARELEATCRSLAEFPKRYPLAPAFGEDVRRATHGAYLIFYVVHEDRVVILHIVHGSNEGWRGSGEQA
jgi:toxin ParE1/3/4